MELVAVIGLAATAAAFFCLLGAGLQNLWRRYCRTWILTRRRRSLEFRTRSLGAALLMGDEVANLPNDFRVDMEPRPSFALRLAEEGDAAVRAYQRSDDVEEVYTKSSFLVRASVYEDWKRSDLIDVNGMAALAEAVPHLLKSVANLSEQGHLLLSAEDVATCFQVAFPSDCRPNLWRHLLQQHERERVAEGPLHSVSDVEKELIQLDAARTRFGGSFNPAMGDPNEALEKTLLAWLCALPQSAEYRQGADSLGAVMLSTFQDVEIAAKQMRALTDVFVPSYFIRGDTMYLRNQLRRLQVLLMFWDPHLAVHLSGLGIPPALYAVPWFITLFADVWPLQRVVHVWDAFFVGGPTLLLFLAVSVLRYNRHRLLQADFSAAMQLFSQVNAGSDIPNVRWCVLKALSTMAQTPAAVLDIPEGASTISLAQDVQGLAGESKSLARAADKSGYFRDIEQERRHSTHQGRRRTRSFASLAQALASDGAEDDDGAFELLQPPVVHWSDVRLLPDPVCMIVDLRPCDAQQHHWLVERNGGDGPSDQRRSFAHFPFAPRRPDDAAKIVTDLVATLRQWGDGYVILVSWTQQNITPVAGVLVRAGIPRVCTWSLPKAFSIPTTSLLQPGGQRG